MVIVSVFLTLALLVGAVAMRRMARRSVGGSIAREQQQRRAWSERQRDVVVDQR